MEYIKIDKQAYKIHFIKTDKFKKVKIRINFKEKTTKEKASEVGLFFLSCKKGAYKR